VVTMEYNFFVGVLPNFDFSIGGWVFFVATALLLLVGSSALLYVFVRNRLLHFKIALLVAYVFVGLLTFGVVGMLMFSLSYFVSYAFITDFTKDY